jgi:hypothetical protein
MEKETLPETNEPQSILADELNEIKQIELEGYQIGIKKARNSLLVVGTLTAIVAAWVYNEYDGQVNYLFWLLYVLPAVIYFVLAFLTKTKPFLAVIIGLILFIGFWILNMFLVGFRAVYSGIFVKVIILFYLYRGLQDAKLYENAKRDLID